MNKFYFYLLYIPIGAFLIFSIGPHLKLRSYLKNKSFWDCWVSEKPMDENSMLSCGFCNGNDIFEQNIFKLPKSVERKLFSFDESVENYNYISQRCRKCQTEIARKIN
jgi:hypothetical protein